MHSLVNFLSGSLGPVYRATLTNTNTHHTSYLQEQDTLAGARVQEPGLHDVQYERGRQTYEDHEEVPDRQVHYEHIGHGPHVVVPPHREADERVPHQTNHERDEVDTDEDDLVVFGPDELENVIVVVFLTPAVFIPAIIRVVG